MVVLNMDHIENVFKTVKQDEINVSGPHCRVLDVCWTAW